MPANLRGGAKPGRRPVFSAADVRKIRALYRKGATIREIAARFNRSKGAVHKVLCGTYAVAVHDPRGPVVRRAITDPMTRKSRKLDWDRVRTIRAAHQAGQTYPEIAAAEGISVYTVRSICLGLRWLHDPAAEPCR